METKRRLKKIGGSVALFIPPEMLEELRLEPGAEVEVRSEGSSIRIRRVRSDPPDDLVEFAQRFTRKYQTALRNLAQR
ncbi:MAG: AbrB/MazE/SpoVT family DNA-binding domain-containing protein [Actinomycetota bacterium]|jgi:antitoxin component of MazEF toxin-antitoxin module|nr:AbrB/MazE/SpoVT family DNA-binding domain-containing protein [Actinomycetota bacterium]